MSAEPSSPARAPLSALTTSAITLGIAGWLSARHLLIALETHGARYVAASSTPPLWVYAIFALAVAALAGFLARAWLRGAPPGARVYRLAPMLLVLLGTVHFLVLPPYRVAPTERIVAAQLELFRESTDFGDLLPLDPAAYDELTSFPPPFLRDGKPLDRWSLLLRKDCTGPVTRAPAGVETGTMILCIASSREEAWITAVGIDGDYAGPPAVVSHRGTPLMIELRKPGETPAAWQQFPADGLKAANETSETAAEPGAGDAGAIPAP